MIVPARSATDVTGGVGARRELCSIAHNLTIMNRSVVQERAGECADIDGGTTMMNRKRLVALLVASTGALVLQGC
ncbi:MAG TPA: hypothetical protein VMT14_20195, partial [Burkholderiaceae bacterium]|nr:hypothetical protein [Burkholderiaceae bacterium]